MKKVIGLVLLVMLVSVSLTGCFGMGGYGQPEATVPPQKEYKTIDELAAAVSSAKADESATDAENLKGLASYYVPEVLPDGAELQYIKVSADAVRIGYSFGPTNDLDYNNQIELVWYRNAKADTFLSDRAQSIGAYDTLELGGISYMHTLPTFQFITTAEPGSTAEATPTPRAGTYCQFLFWAQEDAAFLCAVPLAFTNDDIGKYCKAKKVTLE